jgi:hypothetical protein
VSLLVIASCLLQAFSLLILLEIESRSLHNLYVSKDDGLFLVPFGPEARALGLVLSAAYPWGSLNPLRIAPINRGLRVPPLIRCENTASFSPSRRLYEPEATSHFKKAHRLSYDEKNRQVFQRSRNYIVDQTLKETCLIPHLSLTNSIKCKTSFFLW